MREEFVVHITDLAERDLEKAADYIAYELKNPDAAKNTVQGVRRQINALQIFPERNDLDDDPYLADLGLRMDFYRNYKIYYTVDHASKRVYVIRILHMLVDSRAWLYRTLGLLNLE